MHTVHDWQNIFKFLVFLYFFKIIIGTIHYYENDYLPRIGICMVEQYRFVVYVCRQHFCRALCPFLHRIEIHSSIVHTFMPPW